VLLTAGGLLFVGLGGFGLLYIYMVASMVPDSLSRWDYWSLVLSRMFNFKEAGWYSLWSVFFIVSGCVLLTWGALFADGKPSPPASV
jgi:hypothetical protein